MKTKLFALMLVAVLCIGLVSCASAGKEKGPLGPVEVEIAGVKTGYETLEDAVKAVEKGQVATVTVYQDLSLTKKIQVDDKEITIVDGGTPVTLTDAIAMENFVEYNGNDVCCCFEIIHSGKLILKGTETGGITFVGAGEAASTTKRIMFYIGAGYKDPANEIHGYLEFNKGITVTGIYSTIFGGLVRAYVSTITSSSSTTIPPTAPRNCCGLTTTHGSCTSFPNAPTWASVVAGTPP